MSEEEKTRRETIEEAWDESCNFYQLFDGESDRGAAVLAAALFQDRLQKAIEEKKFHNVDNEVFKRPSLWGHDRTWLMPSDFMIGKPEMVYVLSERSVTNLPTHPTRWNSTTRR